MRSTILVQILLVSLTTFACHLAGPRALAQAWLPPKGEGTLSFTYQKIDVHDHFTATGEKEDRGRIHSHNTIMSVEYGLTDKLALDLDVAFIASRFDNLGFRRPHGRVDDGFYHPTFQDSHMGVRYNLLNRVIVLTPFVSFTIPTHGYAVQGHSAVGRGFDELVVGTYVGKRLDQISPKAYVHCRYSYAFVKHFERLNLNRSNVDWEIGWLANKSISFRFIGNWQRTHGGFDLPQDVHDAHDFDIHDRVAKANYLIFGGGVTFSLNRSFDIHTAYAGTISARNTHGDGGIIIGISWRFSRRGSAGRIAANRSPNVNSLTSNMY
jgi:hypothetical protein